MGKPFTKYFVLLCASVLLCSGIYGQRSKTFSTLVYDEADGLRANDIYGVTEDLKGYIWIGTDMGVYRFDGSDFVHFGYKEGIHSKLITRVFTFSDNSIIALGVRPAAIYRIRDGQVETIEYSPELRIAQAKSFQQKSGAPIYGIAKQRWIVQVSDTAVSKVATVINRPIANNIYVKPSGEIMVGLRKVPGYGMVKEGEQSIHILEDEPDAMIVGFTQSPTGEYWCFSETSLHRELADGSWKLELNHDLAPSYKDVQHLCWDANNRLWAGGANRGLHLYDPVSNRFEQVDHLLDLENVQITYLYTDKEANVWVSTAGHGLLCVLNSDFVNYSTADGLSSNYISSICNGSDNDLWVGTNSGLSQMHWPSDQLQQLDAYPKVKQFPQAGYVNFIRNVPNNMMICGGTMEKSYTQVSSVENLVLFDGTSTASDHPEGGFILTNWGFMAHIKATRPEDMKPILGHYETRILVQGRTIDQLWHNDRHYLISSQKMYEVKAGQLHEMSLPKALRNKKSFAPNLFDLHVDFDNNLWLATSLGVLRQDGDSWTLIDRSHGLSSNLCYVIASDSANRQWIGTDRGLNLLDRESIVAFSKGSGLPSNWINTLHFDPDFDRLWIGTPNGLSVLESASRKTANLQSFPLYISSLEVINDTVFDTPERLTLEPGQNNMRIHFSALNYTHPDEVIFQYKMNHAQLDWIETKAHFAEYRALAPGNYTFWVRSKITGSTWGPPASISLEVIPPLWMRWQSWLLLIVLLSAMMIAFALWRIKTVRKEELAKRTTLSTIAQLEQQALQASMNPHFIFNSLNSIQHFMGKYKDPEAIDYVARFATLIRQNMEAARTKSIRLLVEKERLERYLQLEAMRLDGRLNYKLEVEELLIGKNPKIPSMLIQPFVENSIWHGIAPSGRPGLVSILFSQPSADRIQITIQDNGVGLDASHNANPQGHISQGIKLSRERLQMLSPNNELQIHERLEMGQSIGTEVIILLDLDAVDQQTL